MPCFMLYVEFVIALFYVSSENFHKSCTERLICYSVSFTPLPRSHTSNKKLMLKCLVCTMHPSQENIIETYSIPNCANREKLNPMLKLSVCLSDNICFFIK